jgi:hypothetical protein
MAVTHGRRQRRADREAILSPYTVPNNGWRHFSFWLVPALSLFCFIYGIIYAYTTPFLLVACAAPLAGLALVAIWALPDAKTAPVRSIAPLTLALLVVMIMWPRYLGLQFPGTPWITPMRMIEAPLVLFFLVSLSTSKQFRSELWEVIKACPLVWMLMAAFTAIQVLTLPMAGAHGIGFSMQRFIVQLIQWVALFLISCWIFRKQGRIERVLVAIWIMCVLVSLIAILELHQHKVLWQDHIPSFLKVDTADRYLEAKLRASVGLYRAKATFTTPLDLGDFLAICFPLVMHFISKRYALWIRVLAALSLPIILLGNRATNARSGLVATLAAIMAYTFVWAFKRWRSGKNDLLAPAILAAFPAVPPAALAVTLLSSKLRAAFWGGASTASSNRGRLQEWKNGIPRIMHNPIGYGDGQSGSLIAIQGSHGTYTVDCYYLSLLVDYGILGCLLWIATFMAMLFYASKAMWLLTDQKAETKELSLLTPLAVSIGTFLITKLVISVDDIHPLIYVLMGMIVALCWRADAVLAADKTVKVQEVKGASAGRPSSRPRLRPGTAIA